MTLNPAVDRIVAADDTEAGHRHGLALGLVVEMASLCQADGFARDHALQKLPMK